MLLKGKSAVIYGGGGSIVGGSGFASRGHRGRNDIIGRTIVSQTMLGRAATHEDVGNAAAFVASDRARAMTGATAHVSCGALVD